MASSSQKNDSDDFVESDAVRFQSSVHQSLENQFSDLQLNSASRSDEFFERDTESQGQNPVAESSEFFQEVSECITKVVQHGSISCGDVFVKNSDQVHIGNVTYISGPVYLNQSVTKVEQRTDIKQLFVNVKPELSKLLKIIDRRAWLAQPSIEPLSPLKSPAKYVIICHTATESSHTQAENVYTVRTIQTYHVESRHWHDIGYNFMVGCDGNVYEGRGWNRIGAYAYGYNSCSVGIAFIGFFLNTLPDPCALNACKLLIEKGVSLGVIDPNYHLVGHCQVAAFESPGKRLYEEIKTWPHWTENLTTET